MSYKFLRSYILFCLLATGPALSFGADTIPVISTVQRSIALIERPVLYTEELMEDLERPADQLYREWTTVSLNPYSNITFPDSIVISMKNYHMPTDSTRITDVFGYRPRRSRVHNGLDIKVLKGDTIRAAFSGRVRVSDFQRRGYGYYLVIRHPNGLETVYAHLSKKLVSQGDIVHAGDPIGLGGSTGRSTGSHLHFETRILGKPINPALFFDFPKQTAVTEEYVYYSDPKKRGETEVYYKVRSGDTLSRIASRNGTSVSSICKLNGIKASATIRVGQTLRVK